MKSYTIAEMFSDARPCQEWSESRVADLMAKHGVESVTALDVLTCDDVDDADKIWQVCRMITPEQAAKFAVFCASVAASVAASAAGVYAARASANADLAASAAHAASASAYAASASSAVAARAAHAAAAAARAAADAYDVDAYAAARTRQIKYLRELI